MAGIWEYLKALLVLGPILGLLAVGLIISLRSGVVHLGTSKGLRLLASNFSWVIVRVAGYLAGLAVVQRIIGVQLDLGW